MGEIPVSYLLYADDLVLLSSTSDGLQRHINNLYKFCAAWHLIVSLPKTKVLIFNDHPKARTPKFTYGQETIDIAPEYKYLGLIFSTRSKNALEETVPDRLQKATAAMYQLSGNIKNSVGQRPLMLALKIFKSQVMSVLEYGAEIWGNLTNTQCRNFEKFQLQYLKSVLGVRKQKTTAGVYAETGQIPLQTSREFTAVKYWYRASSLPASHMVNACYQELRKQDESGISNWCSYIRKILSAANSCSYWVLRDNMTRSTLSVIKSNLEKVHINKCMDSIINAGPGNKLRTYKLIKKDFGLEKYLVSVTNPRHRTSLARLRLSSHQLEIEMGRHARPPLEANFQTCKACQQMPQWMMRSTL